MLLTDCVQQFCFLQMCSDLPAATGTGDSERQEAASTAASKEAGKANLLTVTRRNLTLDIIEFKFPWLEF